MKLAAGALALALVAAGCRTVGPNYVRPPLAAPAAYGEAVPAGWSAAAPNDAAARGAWWEIYNDPALNALESNSGDNASLHADEAVFLQARALIEQAASGNKPVVTADPSIVPERATANGAFGASAGITYTSYTLPINVSWMPDFWGRVRRQTEEAAATAQASAADLASARLAVQAEIAADYFQIRGLDGQSAILNSAIEAYSKALQLTQVRHSGGVASGVDVAQAQTQLETTRAQAVDVGVARSQLEHAIAVLTGQPPAGFHVASLPLAATPPAVPVGVPADLLQRRPDIAAAERRIAAANASIGVAKSAFYPTITLAAGAGLESTSVGNLFTLPSTLWTLGASGFETIVAGGSRHAVAIAAERQYDAQASDYRQTVLTAFQEVEDNLAALRVLDHEAAVQAGAVQAAEHSLALSNVRYQGGVTTYLEVITAQSAALADQQAALAILTRRMTASVQLIAALGGGWTASSLPTVTATAHY